MQPRPTVVAALGEKKLSVRLSVVMATRNSARFLPEALASVEPALAPHSQPSIEILVADGGSSDETLAIAERNPHARVVSRQDDGIYSGMNMALAAASGDFVVILNSDDVLLPEALGEALEILAATPQAGWLSGPVLFGSAVETAKLSRHSAPLSIEGAMFGIPAINGRIFRRALLDRIGPLRQELGLAADRELMVRLAETRETGLMFDRPFYFYRVHDGSHTISGDAAGRGRIYRAEMQLARMLIQEPGIGPEFLKLLRASGALARLKLRLTGISPGEPPVTGTGFLPALVKGLVSAFRWRGKLSGY